MVETFAAQASSEQRPKLLPRISSVAVAVSFLLAPFPAIAQSSDPLPEVDPASEASAEPDAAEEPVSTLPEDVRFECQLHQGAYTVMYLPESQPERAYPWATPGDMGGGWTAENRCFTIAERLESYRPEGLAELLVGAENGYDIVCATTEQVPGLCKIVFTVPPGQDPLATRDSVFENLTLADGGNDTTIVNTYTGTSNNNILGQISEAINIPLPGAFTPESDAINLKPFLDPADGGTGSALRSTAPRSRQLNPDNFR